MNVAFGAGSYRVDSSGAHPAILQRCLKRPHCENDQDLSDLEEAALERFGFSSASFRDLGGFRWFNLARL